MSIAFQSASGLLRPFLTQGSGLYALRYGSQVLSRRAFADDSHDDFKAKSKGGEPESGDISSMIKSDIQNNQVFLYMKGVPEAPNCGFSDLACKILRAYEVNFGSRNVLADPEIREGIKKFSNWPTIPQIFVKGEFVGGADILMSMHESGELEKIFGPIREQQKKAN